MTYVLVMIGGGAGALLRYVSMQCADAFIKTPFALGTLLVNCVGALLAGFLINFFNAFDIDAKWRWLVMTGFLGGYTTFSAYSLETARYFMDGNLKYALANIALNNVLCLLLVLAGMWLNKVIFGTVSPTGV